MSRIQRSVIVALVLVAMPHLATAQTRDWDDLADDIARRVERQVDEITRRVERQADQMARRVEIQADQFARLVEQRFEQQGRAAAGPDAAPIHRELLTHRPDRTHGALDLQNVAGDISVTGGGGDDVRIEAVKRVRHPNEAEAKALLSEIAIEVADRGGRVEVRTEYPRRRNWSGGVDFTVSGPRAMQAWRSAACPAR